MDQPRALGVIGPSPRPLHSPVRVRRWRDFERLVGPLDPSADLVTAHAVAHGLLTGVPTVVFSPCEGDSPEAIAVAARALLADDTVACVVAPDVTGEAARVALIEVFERWRGDRGDVGLWLDPPATATSAFEICDQRAGLPGDRSAVRLVTPGVRAITPGLPRARRLPGSCVIGALSLGVAAHLGGLHELERRYTDAATRRLRGSGAGLLVATGRRRLIGLAFPAPLPRPHAVAPEPPTDPIEPALHDPIERALHDATAPLITRYADGPALWQALAREAQRVMETFRGRGAITGFAVRCDAETHALADGHPALEVWYRTPRRVREVRLLTRPRG